MNGKLFLDFIKESEIMVDIKISNGKLSNEYFDNKLTNAQLEAVNLLMLNKVHQVKANEFFSENDIVYYYPDILDGVVTKETVRDILGLQQDGDILDIDCSSGYLESLIDISCYQEYIRENDIMYSLVSESIDMMVESFERYLNNTKIVVDN